MALEGHMTLKNHLEISTILLDDENPRNEYKASNEGDRGRWSRECYRLSSQNNICAGEDFEKGRLGIEWVGKGERRRTDHCCACLCGWLVHRHTSIWPL